MCPDVIFNVTFIWQDKKRFWLVKAQNLGDAVTKILERFKNSAVIDCCQTNFEDWID